MSIQLVLLRPHYQTPEEISAGKKPRNYHAFPRKKSAPASIQDLFENNLKYLGELYPDERVNCFYTIAHCEPGAIRKFVHLDTLALDADGIDRSRILDYIPIVARILNISPDEMTVTSSGNGMHFLIKLQKNILEAELDDLQDHYTAVTQKMEAALKEAGLPAHFDMILDRGRILRMPGTVNRKHNKPETHATIVQKNFTPHNIQLKLLSGLPDVPEERAVNVSKFTKLTQPDTVTVLSSCEFLKWTRNSPTEVKEPQGYAAISVLAHLDNGREITKEYISRWTNSSSIAQWDADDKIDQATNAARARTCKDINNKWGKCSTCAFNGTVKSPISLKSPDFIASKTTGFHDKITAQNGAVKFVPNYDDLLKFFHQEKPYFYQSQGKTLWRFTGTHYRDTSDAEIKHFAETHFLPKPKETMRLEFLSKVKANYLKTLEETQAFFAKTIHSKLNLANGVLDLVTGEVKPHSPDYGFRYVLPYAYDPTATCPRFDRFLTEITLARAPFQQVILDCMAAILIPGYDQFDAAFWWFQGVGRNGKSKLVETMQLMVGPENTTVMDPVSLAGESARFRLADLDSKLLCIIEEVNERTLGSRLLGVLKNISAGGTVPVERKGRDPVQMKSTAKLVLTANASPILEDTTAAVKARLIPVPFDLNLADPTCPIPMDTNLMANLGRELPGILNRVLPHVRELLKRGRFHNPPESRAIMSQMARDSDSVEAWIHARLDLEPAGEPKLAFGDAYEDYARYVEENPVSRKTFAARLKNKLGVRGETRKTKVGGQVVPTFHGITLQTDTPDHMESPHF